MFTHVFLCCSTKLRVCCTGSWDPLYGGGENMSGGIKPQVLHRIDDDNVVSVSSYDFEFPFPTGRPPRCDLLQLHTIRKDHVRSHGAYKMPPLSVLRMQ